MKIFSVLLIIVFCLTTNIFSQVEFTPHTITTSASGAESVYAADVDSDGDIDVLSASQFDNKIAWYENDGNENFTEHPITTNANSTRSVYAIDVNGDGDMDVLSAAGSTIAWYENDGNENFTEHPITTSLSSARLVYAVDVDGDTDMDVLSASKYDNKIAWYENDLVNSIAISNEIPIEFSLSQNYPNPFNPTTIIKYQIPELSFVTLKIYDVLGSEIATLVNEEKPIGSYVVELNAKGLPSGIFFYKLQAGSFVETKKMILIK